MPDIKYPKCDHPKCGAKMQRVYKRGDSTFLQCGWLCTDCGMFKKDNQTHWNIPGHMRNANRNANIEINKLKIHYV